MSGSKTKILLVGCGKMGGALLKGWLRKDVSPDEVAVLDPHPAPWLADLVSQGLTLNQDLDTAPDIVVVATKPQVMDRAIPNLRSYGGGHTLILSIAAGTPISSFEAMLGKTTPVIRAMPNTPAAIGAGVTALIGNAAVTAENRSSADQLMQAVGQTVWLDDEDQMHAVTGLSGSGPAYVFAMAEAMTEAGEKLGLNTELSRQLAIATISGAGRLMTESGRLPSDLREEVTSPNGTTAAGLERIFASNGNIRDLMTEVVAAASNRSRTLM